MNSLPTNIEKKFLEIIRKDIPIDEFEQWVYQSKQLKEILATNNYFELISIDFKSNDAWENLYKILRGHIRVHRASKLLDPQEKVPFIDWIGSIFKLPLLDYSGDIEDLMLPLPNSKIKLKYLVQLLQSPSRNLTGYTADQIGQGLDYLFNDLFQDDHVFIDSSLDWEFQKKGIRSIEILFREIFAIFSDPTSLMYANSEVLDCLCLMWWDIFPSWGNPSNEYMRNHHDKEMLLVMERTLYSRSLTCIESALHGLNHWVGNYRERINQIIDKFLSNRSELPPEIHEQAEWAKKGTMP